MTHLPQGVNLIALEWLTFKRQSRAIPLTASLLRSPLYARGLGLEPHADFAKAAGHLGEWDGVCDLEFGKDGMPMYIEGPRDDTWRIMHTLRQNVGDGNFHYLVGLRS